MEGRSSKQGGERGNQRRKVRENSEVREAGRAALGPTIKQE